MSVFWRPMSDRKVLDCLVQTFTGGLGMDTVRPYPVQIGPGSATQDTSVWGFAASVNQHAGVGEPFQLGSYSGLV